VRIEEKIAVPPAGKEPGDLGAYLRILWSAKWKIAAFSILVGVASLVYLLTLPNIYRATAVVKPDNPDAANASQGLGALISLGLPVGIPSKSEDLEVVFKSRDLAIRVFRKYAPWQALFPDTFDPQTRTLKRGWLDRLLNRGDASGVPGEWDAIRVVKAGLSVESDRRTGVLSVSFDSTSREGSAQMVRYLLDEAKSKFQEEALTRANRNKEFIMGQLARTVDPLTRDRLYALYGQEVEKEMLARNREQFGFTVVDPTLVPDRKHKPARARKAAAFVFAGFLFACGFILVRHKAADSAS
jgi:uncharacterized protein involved in exopolysaccharide biosynthesis